MSRLVLSVSRALCALAFVAVADSSASASEPDLRAFATLTSPRAAGLYDLYSDRPATVADYVTAQTRMRAAVEQGLRREAAPLISTSSPPAFVPYLWETIDGSAIRKLGDGSFVVVSSRLLANWHAERRCFGADWPNFVCADQSTHTMAAPDLGTLIFDGVEYSRYVPVADVDPITEAEEEAVVAVYELIEPPIPTARPRTE
ncbi:MAG: hypothetical protein AB7I79_09420 [Rhizobiaceae bacterium]